MVNKMKTRQFIIITLIMAGTKLVNLSQAAIQPPGSNTINVDRERQAQNVTLRSSLPAMVHTRQMSMGGEVYDQLLISGGTLLQAGAPNVPAVSRWVAIPVGVIPQLQVIPGKAVEVGFFNIDPVQPLRVDGDAPPPPFVKTEAIYADDSFYPGSFAEITQRAKLRAQPMILVELHPYQYNPVTGRLVCYPDLTVNVVTQDGNSPATRLRSKAGDTRLQRLDPTVETVLSLTAESAVQPLATGFGDDDDRCEFLIICDPSYENAANRLASWRMYENMPTVVATTDETGSTTNEIQDYIRHAYTNWSLAPSYCLLIGDRLAVPRNLGYDSLSNKTSIWISGGFSFSLVFKLNKYSFITVLLNRYSLNSLLRYLPFIIPERHRLSASIIVDFPDSLFPTIILRSSESFIEK